MRSATHCRRPTSLLLKRHSSVDRDVALFRQLVEVLDEGHGRAIEALDFRVGRFDDVVFVGRVRAAAVTEPEMTGGKFERLTSKHVTRIRTGVSRPKYWINSEFFVAGDLRLDERGIGRCEIGRASCRERVASWGAVVW